MSKFTLYTDKNNEFRWKFTASNDHVVARSSEGHKTKDLCLESLGLLQKDVVGAAVDPVVMSVTGQKPVLPLRQAPAAVVAPAGTNAPAISGAPVIAPGN